MQRNLWVFGVLLVVAFATEASADLVSDARTLQITLLQNEREINRIANFKIPPKGVPSKLVDMFRETKHLAEKCLAGIKTAKVYAKKVEFGDKSSETIKVLQTHLYKLRLVQDELDDSVANLNAAIKAWQPSSP